MLHALHVARNDGGQQTGRHHQIDIGRVLRPANGVVAQHHVTVGAAAQCGDKGNHDHAKNIHIAPPGSKRARHGFGGDGDQVDDQNDVQLGAEDGMQKVKQGGHSDT